MDAVSRLLILLLVACPAIAAPRLKDKPGPYKPKTWVDVLANAPATDLPWQVIDQHVRGMDRETWIAIGQELSRRLGDRDERAGLERTQSLFDFAEHRDELTPAHVAGLLYHAKWFEAIRGKRKPFFPPTSFWHSGRIDE